MLFIIRFVVVVIFSILICVFWYPLLSVQSEKSPSRCDLWSHVWSAFAAFGLKVEVRVPPVAADYGNCIYIANHQNNYDMVTAANAVQPRTVTVGKKSLMWIPFLAHSII